MKNIIQQIAKKNKVREALAVQERRQEIDNPSTPNNRRNFLKKTALGGISLAAFMGLSFEDTVAQATSKVKRESKPSKLKITDLRYCLTTVLGRTAIIRIDTNQGIYGLGAVRDGADPRYALMLKSRILGENPCNVENNLEALPDKREEYAEWRWRFGTCAAKLTMCRPGNSLGGNIGILLGYMPIRPRQKLRRNN